MEMSVCDVQDNERARKIHFHMKGCTRRTRCEIDVTATRTWLTKVNCQTRAANLYHSNIQVISMHVDTCIVYWLCGQQLYSTKGRRI